MSRLPFRLALITSLVSVADPAWVLAAAREAPPADSSVVDSSVHSPPDDCAVEFQYPQSNGQNALERVEAARGETKTVNHPDVLFVVNVEERPASVRVTIPTGGEKWVRLEEDQKDPPVANYVGSVTLLNVRCEYLHDSPVAMFTSLVGGGESQVTAAGAVKDEFELGASDLMDALHTHFGDANTSGPEIAGRVLDEHFGLSLLQIAQSLEGLGYGAESTMAGLLATLPPIGGPGCGPLFQAMRSAGFSPVEVASGYRGARAQGAVEGATDAELASCMSSADFTAEEAGTTLYELASMMGSVMEPAVLINHLDGEGYGLAGATRGAAAAYSATPLQAAQWLADLSLPWGSPDVTQQAYALKDAFDAQGHNVFSLLRQVGHPQSAVVGAVRAAFDATPVEMAVILGEVNLPVSGIAGAILDEYPLGGGGGVAAEGEIMRVLREAGHPAAPVAQAVENLAESGHPRFIPLGQPNHFDWDTLVSWLIYAGYSPQETAAGYQAVFSGTAYGVDDMAWRLHQLGRAEARSEALTWAQAIHAVYGLDGPGLLENLSGWALDVRAYVVGEIFGAGPAQMVAWLLEWRDWDTGAGAEAGLLGELVASQYSAEPAEAAGWLRDGGFPTLNTLDAVRIGWSLDVERKLDAHQAMAWLHGAGFDGGEIASAVALRWASVNEPDVSSWLALCSGGACPLPDPRPVAFAFEHAGVVGGNTARATVTLDLPVPEGALEVASSDPAVAPVPDRVQATGEETLAFTFRTAEVTAPVTTIVTVTGDGLSRSAELRIGPPSTKLSAIRLDSETVVSGGSTRGFIEILEVSERTEPLEVTLSLEGTNGTVEPAVVTLDARRPRGEFVVQVAAGSRAIKTEATAYVVATSRLDDRRKSFTVEPAEVHFVADPPSVVIGEGFRLTLELAQPAPERTGTSLALSASDPALLELPDRIEVPPGESRVDVQVATADPRVVGVESAVVVTIEASAADDRSSGPVATTDIEIHPGKR